MRRRIAVSAVVLFILSLPPCGPCAFAQGARHSARLLPLPTPGKGLTLALHWDIDAYGNLDGGARRGYATDSVASAGLGLDTGALGAWRGGMFQLGLQAITSTHPSAYVGDAQTESNLDAPDQRQISALWYAQDLGRAKIRGGIMDVNNYFDVTGSADLLTNASFGITPTVTADVETPTYPAPSGGVMARLGPRNDDWLVGAYQGDPARRSTALRDGSFLVAERGWRDAATGFHLGIGAWYRRAAGTAPQPGSDWGLYTNIEHALPGLPRATAFVQLAGSPSAVNPVPAYLGAGIDIRNVTPAIRQVSLGMARAWIRDRSAETSVEATALLPLGDGGGIALQPDLQYVFHPSGFRPNALVVALRLHLTLY